MSNSLSKILSLDIRKTNKSTNLDKKARIKQSFETVAPPHTPLSVSININWSAGLSVCLFVLFSHTLLSSPSPSTLSLSLSLSLPLVCLHDSLATSLGLADSTVNSQAPFSVSIKTNWAAGLSVCLSVCLSHSLTLYFPLALQTHPPPPPLSLSLTCLPSCLSCNFSTSDKQCGELSHA